MSEPARVFSGVVVACLAVYQFAVSWRLRSIATERDYLSYEISVCGGLPLEERTIRYSGRRLTIDEAADTAESLTLTYDSMARWSPLHHLCRWIGLFMTTAS